MGTYEIPRNTKGEGRILFIFTTKSLIYSVAGGLLGILFYFIFKMLNLTLVGIIITLVFALIGYAIGTFKLPKIASIKSTNDIAGENIDDIIKRYIKFKKNKRKVYIYKEEEEVRKNA